MRNASLDLICPCGECALDPREWECRDCASPAELKAAECAYALYIAEKLAKVSHA